MGQIVWIVQWRVRKWRELGFLNKEEAGKLLSELVTAKGVKECYMFEGPFTGNKL